MSRTSHGESLFKEHSKPPARTPKPLSVIPGLLVEDGASFDGCSKGLCVVAFQRLGQCSGGF